MFGPAQIRTGFLCGRLAHLFLVAPTTQVNGVAALAVLLLHAAPPSAHTALLPCKSIPGCRRMSLAVLADVTPVRVGNQPYGTSRTGGGRRLVQRWPRYSAE
jgi:hypothetical protein